jgi:hypothetical protein
VSTVLPGLPPCVEVYEVGPRDGLQNEERAWMADRLAPPRASRTVDALAARCSPGDPT